MTYQKMYQKCIKNVSKNVYIDKFDNIVNKYNNTYHMLLVMLKAHSQVWEKFL